MFALYHDKQNKVLRIEPAKKLSINQIYNNCYFFCNNKDTLKIFANNLKKKWIEETEKELNELKKIKIKNKY